MPAVHMYEVAVVVALVAAGLAGRWLLRRKAALEEAARQRARATRQAQRSRFAEPAAAEAQPTRKRPATSFGRR